jgi:glycosyltransferase involved in cell wall biosynthesis
VTSLPPISRLPARMARGRAYPVILAIAWSAATTRASEIAASLNGRALQLGSMGLPRGAATVPLRYTANVARTVIALARRRPDIVVVQNPPILLGLLGYGYARLFGAQLVLDSHPVSFGRKPPRIYAALVPLHRWVARRSRLVLVTVDELADVARAWGAEALLLHEAPPTHVVAAPPRPLQAPPVALFVSVFAPDEPVAAVVEAARRLPEVRFQVTGNTDLAPPELLRSAPNNVEFVGFRPMSDYLALLAAADVVLALTTEPTSVVRAAYEAVYAERPLVVSAWPTLIALFPHAVHVEGTADSITDGVRRAVANHDALVARAAEARELQHRRWDSQLGGLRNNLGLPVR